jgi:hypothetical protein
MQQPPHQDSAPQRTRTTHTLDGLSTLSGAELPYANDRWKSLPNMDKLNCYDYALANANPHQTDYSQPVTTTDEKHIYTCGEVETGLLAQHPSITVAPTFEEACPKNSRKIALMVDSDDPSDYHFMRQDADGLWSHKPGYREPQRTDAAGKPIVAPHLSDRNYEWFNYTHMCNYYCIPNGEDVANSL